MPDPTSPAMPPPAPHDDDEPPLAVEDYETALSSYDAQVVQLDGAGRLTDATLWRFVLDLLHRIPRVVDEQIAIAIEELDDEPELLMDDEQIGAVVGLLGTLSALVKACDQHAGALPPAVQEAVAAVRPALSAFVTEILPLTGLDGSVPAAAEPAAAPPAGRDNGRPGGFLGLSAPAPSPAWPTTPPALPPVDPAWPTTPPALPPVDGPRSPAPPTPAAPTPEIAYPPPPVAAPPVEPPQAVEPPVAGPPVEPPQAVEPPVAAPPVEPPQAVEPPVAGPPVEPPQAVEPPVEPPQAAAPKRPPRKRRAAKATKTRKR